MGDIQLQIPAEALLALKVSEDAAVQELLMVAAVKLYEMDKLSSGAAAQLAGIPRTVFLSRLTDYDVDTFRLDEGDLLQETQLG